MSRELQRRLAALEAARSARRIRYEVSRQMPEEEPDPQNVPMTEGEWVTTYCE